MIKHSQFYRYEKRILEETGINIRFIQFQQLVMSPELSLIFAGAWFMANVESIPKNDIKRNQIMARYWAHYSPSIH